MTRKSLKFEGKQDEIESEILGKFVVYVYDFGYDLSEKKIIEDLKQKKMQN